MLLSCFMSYKPWERHPDLTQERLEYIGNLLREIAGEVYKEHKPSLGDSSWGRGCKLYDRILNTFKRLDEQVSWITIEKTNSLRLVFLVGEVPIRICRDRKHAISQNYMKEDGHEIEARQMAFPDMVTDRWLRLAICRGAGGIKQVKLLEVDGLGSIYETYEITLSDTTLILRNVRKQPVELEPHRFRSKRKSTREAEEQGTDDA